MAKKAIKVEKEIPVPAKVPNDVPCHLHIDMEKTITALDLLAVKRDQRIIDTNKRIDRMVDAISRSRTVKGI